jgi:hypothetical protein
MVESDSDCMDSWSSGMEHEVDRLMDGASRRVGNLIAVAAGYLF